MSTSSSPQKIISDLREIFQASVNSVKPHTIFHQKKCLKICDNKLKVSINETENDEFNIKGKNIHLIGFGKAVLGLAVEVENVLKSRLVSGVISIPIGSATTLQENSVVKVIEGAKDNLPDENAYVASQEIFQKCKKMTQNDVLLCLISGGGSALLPYPTPPITLQEKTDIIRLLSRKGATIDELNIVRIAMSYVKGGKLAYAAKNASQVISLIISDIINDPLDLIASGPTVVPTRHNAFDILQKFDGLASIPDQVLNVIKSYRPVSDLINVRNYVIANNEIAIQAGMQEAKWLGYETVFLSKDVTGDVKDVCQLYQALTLFLINKRTDVIKKYPEIYEKLQKSLKSSRNDICIISGGEPTVKVTGTGVGGRNQELALRFAQFCTVHDISRAYLLSSGTDGMDGPGNDAAGAIGTNFSGDMREIIEKGLKNNDSYNFYKKYKKDLHVVTGHTGTNVMDVQILIVLNDKKMMSNL